MVYKIDVPVFHWDNDRYEAETKTLEFSTAENALRARLYLRDLDYEPFWSFDQRPCFVFLASELGANDSVLKMLNVWHGGIFKDEFKIYTEKICRTTIGD